MRDLALERGLPANLEAERYVLGSITRDPECFPLLAEFLTGDEFSLSANRQIFRTMRELYSDGMPIDRVTVASFLLETGKLESIGGSGYLLDLEDGLPRLQNVESYARIVLEQYKRRQAIIALQAGIDAILTGSDSTAVDEIVQKLNLVRESNAPRRKLKTAEEIILEIGPDELTAPKFGIRTGFPTLDSLTCGLRAGQLVIIGGRPASGKTSMLWQIANYVSRDEQRRTALFSCEMSDEELIHRAMCSKAGVSQTVVRNGSASFVDLRAALNYLAENKRMVIDDTANCTVESIRAMLQRERAKDDPIELVLIDYLGLMGAIGRYERRHEAVTEITRGLKLTAKEFRIPIVVLCQFNRLMETESRRPNMADFRDSGSIEQDADVCLGVWVNAAEKLTELLILKQRNGPITSVNMRFDGRLTTFSEI